MTPLPRRRRRRTTPTALVVAGLVVAGLLGACTSSGSDGGTSARTSSTADATSSTPSPSSATPATPDVTVTPASGAPLTLTPALLLTLPRITVRAADGTPVSGVTLSTVAGLSGPSPSAASTPFVTYDVAGSGGRVLLTRAETDPRIGDHPALLTIIEGTRIDLVVPQDRTPARTLTGVTAVTASTVSPSPAQPSPGRGSVVVRAAGRSTTVALTTLEQRGYTLRRPGAPTTQERGARLSEVLTAAGITVTGNQLVTVSGPSGSAILTGGELVLHAQEVGLSLAQDGRALDGPLFFVSGDVTATRSVVGATTIVVSG